MPDTGRDWFDGTMENEQPSMATHLTDNGTILVIGGTGKTGRRIAERLTQRGIPVRIGSRSGAPVFNWDDADTWDAALRGVEKAYVSYYPDLAFPGVSDLIAEFAKAAAAHGVRKMVLLSGRALVQELRTGLRTWGNDANGSDAMLVGTYRSSGEVGDLLLSSLPSHLLVEDAGNPVVTAGPGNPAGPPHHSWFAGQALDGGVPRWTRRCVPRFIGTPLS